MKSYSIFIALLILFSPVVYGKNFKLISDAVAQASEVTEQQVAELYVATFNRAPDAAGLDFWVNDSGFTIEQIAESFFDQPETQGLYLPGTTVAMFVTSVYDNLFNRVPDVAGFDYWVDALGSGAVTRPVMIEAVKNGAQGTDAKIVANKAEVGLYYASLGLEGGGFSLAGVTDAVDTVVDKKRLIFQNFGITLSKPLNFEITETKYTHFRWVFTPPEDMFGITGYTIFHHDTGHIYFDIPYPYNEQVNFLGGDDLEPYTDYCFDMASRDDNGNYSEKFGPVCGTTFAENDYIKPSTPENLSIAWHDDYTIKLKWDHSTDNDTLQNEIEYKIWDTNAQLFGSVKDYSGGFVHLTRNDISLDSENEYCFRISAVDNLGNESKPSSEACIGGGPMMPHFQVYASETISDVVNNDLPWNGPNDNWDLIYESNQQVNIVLNIQSYKSVYIYTTDEVGDSYHTSFPFKYDYIALDDGAFSINNWRSSNIEGGPNSFLQAVGLPNDGLAAFGKFIAFPVIEFPSRKASTLSIKTTGY